MEPTLRTTKKMPDDVVRSETPRCLDVLGEGRTVEVGLTTGVMWDHLGASLPRMNPMSADHAKERNRDEEVDEASVQSFPASDPPPFSAVHAGPPRRETFQPDKSPS